MKPLDLPDPVDGAELTPQHVSRLSPSIESGECLLVDCREQDEWDFNRIAGAHLIPLSRFTELAPPLTQKGKPVIIYCHHGMRSLQATQWLRSKGLENVWSMSGGIHAWSCDVDSDIPTY